MSIPGAEEKPIRPDAVAIYVRWSTEEQGEGTTLQEQLERSKAFVVSQGWQVNESLIFIDDGYSGASLLRPAITRLRELVKQGQIDCVVSLKIDRLSRSLVDCVELVLREWAGVCHYKSVSQPVNTTDPLGRVFFAILAGFAEYERALIRERTYSGLLRRVRDGSIWGSGKPPYGYARIARGKLAVNEGEAGVVRLIFRLLVAEGLGPTAIATRLNKMGIPGPLGKGWWAFTLRNILKSKIYIGYPEFGRRFWMQMPNGRRVLKKRAEPLVEPTTLFPDLVIIDPQTFGEAQRKLRQKSEAVRENGRRADSSHLLTGVLRCRCGGRMISGYDALGRRYYRCSQKELSRGGKGCSAGGGFIYAPLIEPLVAQELVKRIADPETVLQNVKECWERGQVGGDLAGDVVKQRLTDLERQGKRLEEDLARVVRQARRGEISLAEKRAFEADAEAERQQLQAQRVLLEREPAQRPSRAELEALLDWVAQVDPWGELAVEAQKELLRRLVEHIEVYKPKGKGRMPEVDLFWRV